MSLRPQQMFNPPLPSDIAVSFYIHTSKLVLALYVLHTNSQAKVEITHRVQVSQLLTIHSFISPL